MSFTARRGHTVKCEAEEPDMGKLVVTEFVTLDGVAEDPGGAEKTAHGGWAFAFDRGPEGDAFKQDELQAADAQLLGRVTYEGFAQAWPNRKDDPFGQKMNEMPKHVVSSHELAVSWTNSTRLEGDLAAGVGELKDRYRGDILVAGSISLVQALTEHELVDEYRLMLYPVVLGSGKRLFPETGPHRALRLREAKPAGECMTLVYERKGA
jgi:dihydrofolate reductase